MEKSGFFNSVNGDRKYQASSFAEFFASFIGNGVFPNPSTNLQIIANNNMTVTVKQGKAWINGYFYVNTDDLILNIDVADGVLKRIDRIVLQYNTINREIKAKVKKGTFASSPTAPVLQRDADAYELGIADITINNGAVSITQANITDLRLNNTYCGIIHGTVDQVDTTTLFNQYQTWLSEKKSQYDTDMTAWTNTKQTELNTYVAGKQTEYQTWYNTTTTAEQAEIDAMEAQFQQDWDTWFAGVQGQLSGDVAGNLLNLINNHKADKSNPHEVTPAQIGAETPAGAQAKVDVVAQALTTHEGSFAALKINLIDTNINLETLKGSILTGVNANIVVETFQNTDDIIVFYGIYGGQVKCVNFSEDIKVLCFGFCFE